jgi:hypothetical protein
MHSLQTLIVALIVPGCMFYAAWKLMPATLRQSLATSILRLPHLPSPIEATLQKAAQKVSGCGCDGCDRSSNNTTVKKKAVLQPIVFHSRIKP